MATNCTKCKGKILKKDLLKCSSCSSSYHADCSGHPIKLFEIMTRDRKSTWKCKPCGTTKRVTEKPVVNLSSNPKKSNIESTTPKPIVPTSKIMNNKPSCGSPVGSNDSNKKDRILEEKPDINEASLLNLQDAKSSSHETIYKESSFTINIPTRNSYEFLIVEDKDLESTISNSSQMCKSTSSDSDTLRKAEYQRQSSEFITQRRKFPKIASLSFDETKKDTQISHQSLPDRLVDGDELAELREELDRLKMELLSAEGAIE